MGKGRPKKSLDITVQERADLEAICASRRLPNGLVRRARMILLTDSGMSVRETARRLKVTPPAVSNWLKRFRELRLSGLHDQLKSGRPRSHSDEDIAALLNTAMSQQPKAASHWSVRDLAGETGISKSTVQRYLKLFSLQPHRSKSFKLSNDPFFIEKVRDVVGLYLNPPDKALVLCVDEKSQGTSPAAHATPVADGTGLCGRRHARLCSPWHHHAVRGARYCERTGLDSVQGAPSASGVPELLASY